MITFRGEIIMLRRSVASFTREQVQAGIRAAEHSVRTIQARRAREAAPVAKPREDSATLRSRIVELLRNEGPMGAADVGRRLQNPRGTAHKSLTALVEQERVVRKSAGVYEVAG